MFGSMAMMSFQHPSERIDSTYDRAPPDHAEATVGFAVSPSRRSVFAAEDLVMGTVRRSLTLPLYPVCSGLLQRDELWFSVEPRSRGRALVPRSADSSRPTAPSARRRSLDFARLQN